MKRFCFLPFIYLLLLSSCARDEDLSTYTGEAMTMQYRIIIGEPIDADLANRIEQTIASTFHTINAIHNKWNPDSELSRINQLPAHTKVPLSEELFSLLMLADHVHKISKGRFDPTIEPLQQLWKEQLTQGLTPTDQEIEAKKAQVGWHLLHFDSHSISKDVAELQIDLGGIAKGHCIDLLLENLSQLGLQNTYVEWGGEIGARGQHSTGRPWTIFISALGNTEQDNAIAILPLYNQSIATSGDYLQNWTVKAKPEDFHHTTYFHIIDPMTLRPLTASYRSIASASIVADSCAFADGIATAAMLFPSLDEAAAWLEEVQEQYPEVRFWLASRELLAQKKKAQLLGQYPAE